MAVDLLRSTCAYVCQDNLEPPSTLKFPIGSPIKAAGVQISAELQQL